MLRWALVTAKAHEAAKVAGKVDASLEPPRLLPGLSEWYEDFLELSTDRQIGMAEGPIPKTSIDNHVRGWPYDEADMFRICMRAMDDIYLKHRAGKLETPQPKGGRNLAMDNFIAALGSHKGRYKGKR